MTEPAGWAGWAAQLPLRTRAAIEREDAREVLESRRAEEERENAREAWRDANMALAREQASLRGELVGALALARGEVTGRTIGDVLAEAARAGDAQDARDQVRASREADGGLAHVFVGEPQLRQAPARRSGLAAQLYNRGNAFVHRARKAREAEEARERELNVLPLAQAVQIRRQEGSGVVYAGPSQRSGSVLTARDARAGGPEPGFGPANVPWSQAGQWLARGWTP